jgi:LPXTG-motif cell wall-anchored protein
MKKTLAFALITMLLLPILAIPAFAAVPDGAILWNNFVDRDPRNKPELAANGMNLWWDNWANLRASVDGGIVTIEYRPGEFDPEDYDDMEDYYSRMADWGGNWGEAVNMWALEGIGYCKYLTIRIRGAAGGEENKLLLHFEPEDSKTFIKRFSDLVLADGSKAKITTGWQDLKIDLAASGFPGMTNRMHIRAFAGCTISMEYLYFSDVVGALDPDAPLAGMTAAETGKLHELPIAQWIADLEAGSNGANGENGANGTTTPPPPNRPSDKTGDTTMIALAIGAFLLAAGATVLIVRKVKA